LVIVRVFGCHQHANACATFSPIPQGQYGIPSYWEERYCKDTDPFDWYQRYGALRNLITMHVPKDGAILVPGCGNSTLSEDMFADGFVGGIANIDISRTVVDAQAERLKNCRGLTCA
jgi:hypothetical protein